MVNLDIQVTGLASVNRAFQQIEARAKQLDNKLKAAGSGGARAGAGRQVNEAAKAERAAAAEARKAHQEKMRQIKAQDDARKKAIKDAENAEKKAIQATERQRRAAVNSIHKSLSNTIAGITKAISAAVALLGGISAKTAVDDRLKAGTKATQVSITAHGSDGDNRSLVQRRKDLLGVTKDVSAKTGTSQNDLMDMIGAFVSKGGASTAIEKDLEFYDKVARVTGTEHKDIGDLAASTFIGLTDEGMSAADALAKTREQMLMFATNAKNGSFELNDFAATAGLAAGAAKKFEGGLAKNFDLMNALGQIAVGRGGARPAEANTAVSRLPSDIQTNAHKFKKLGVNVFNDKGALKNPVEIFKSVFEKTGGRMDKMPVGLLGAESRKIFDPMAAVYRDAFDKAGGGKAGKEAGIAALDKLLADFASGKFGMKELNEASEFQQQDEAVRATKAMNQLKIAMADELVPVLISTIIPALVDLAPKIKDAAKMFGELIKAFANNPIAGLGAIVAAKVTADIAGAAIGGAVKDAITKAIGGGGGTGGSGGAGGKGGVGVGLLGAAGIGLTIGTITAATITAGTLEYAKQRQKDADRSAGQVATARIGGDPEKTKKIIEQERAHNKKLKGQQSVLDSVKAIGKDPWSIGAMALGFGGIVPAVGWLLAGEEADTLSTENKTAIRTSDTALEGLQGVLADQEQQGFLQWQQSLGIAQKDLQILGQSARDASQNLNKVKPPSDTEQ